MQPSPQQVLEDRFGHAAFMPGQRKVIDRLLEGKSAAAVFPTGGGKSLCYQLPSLFLPGLTLVVSPLIALMKDQIDALLDLGIDAARLDSTLGAEEYRALMERIRREELRLLYVSPERFNNERFRESIGRVRISLFAVDEAHCISEWGHNFRPDYLKLAQAAEEFGAERILALTATATPRVLEDICRFFGVDPQDAVRTPFYRPNLTLLTSPVERSQRDAQLLAELREKPPGPTIVYVTQQQTAEDVARAVSGAGFVAKAYHAGMENADRTSVQDWFMKSSDGIVVATIAFGMGIDKSDIRSIYHYNLPKSLENFAQEIGRAGRDGRDSVCHSFVCLDDLNVLENFVYGDTPTVAAVRDLVEFLFGQQPERFSVSMHDLAAQHDIRLLVVKTLLTNLELDGYLEGGTPYFTAYKFAPGVPVEDILGRFRGERRAFLEALFAHAEKGKKWFKLDPSQTANVIGADRGRIVRALDYFGEQNLMEVQPSGIRNRYRRLRGPEDREGLAASLHQRAVARETREIQRLNDVVRLFRLQACRVDALGRHFGEPLPEPCGHCSWCLTGDAQQAVPARRVPPLDARAVQGLDELCREHPDVLSGPRPVARFLCGLSSPKIARAKLGRHALFGVFSEVPFQTVLAWAEGP